MPSIDRRRALRLSRVALLVCAIPGCFSGPAGPEAPNKPVNPEPPPKVDAPKGKHELPKQVTGRPID
jgi:hypothetical protein